MAPPNPREIIETSREMRRLGLEATANDNRSINDGDDNPVQGVQTNSISNQGRQPAPYAPPRVPETSNMAARMPRRRVGTTDAPRPARTELLRHAAPPKKHLPLC